MKRSRWISLVLAAVLLLAGCGGGEKQEGSKEAQKNNDTVFKEERDVFEVKGDSIANVVLKGDTIYVEQYEYAYDLPEARTEITEETANPAEEIAVAEETAAAEVVGDDPAVNEEEVYEVGTAQRTITGFSADGEVKSTFTGKVAGNEGYGAYTLDGQGNMYSVFYEYASYEGEDTRDKIYLKGCKADGTELWKISLNENISENDYYYVNTVMCDDNGHILLNSSRGVEIYDTEGNPVRNIETSQEEDCQLVAIRDGKFAVTSVGETPTIQTVDLESGTLGEKVTLPFVYYSYSIVNGSFYDLYLTNEYGVYGYNIGDAEITKLMDFFSSDFYNGYFTMTPFIDETSFVAYYYDEGKSVISKFVKVPAEEVKEKTELTLGCVYFDYSIKQKLVDFNKNSDEYRITVMDYSQYNTMDDYSQGMTRLNADIVSGNVPDILCLTSGMPVNSYIAKGVLEDLNTYFEKDEDISREDLLENVLESLSSEDGLYRIGPSFSVNTFAAKSADVGEEPGWTMEDALELLASKPEGTQLLGEMTSDTFMYYVMRICGEQYADWNTGECNFESQGFVDALEFAATLPREIDYSQYDDEYWREAEMQYRNGKTLVCGQYLSCFRDYSYAKQATFGEDITLIGFPTKEGIGAALNIPTTVAISAASENKDIAWEFIKSFLSEEYQDEVYDFPIRKSSLEKQAKKAQEKPYYTDENGNIQEYDDTFFISDEEIPAEPLNKEETDKLMDYIKSLDQLCADDESLYNIVTEETESFFAGQKSAAEVASVIQSRAKIYISENK